MGLTDIALFPNNWAAPGHDEAEQYRLPELKQQYACLLCCFVYFSFATAGCFYD